MNSYYFQGSGIHISQSPVFWYFAVILMALITITVGFAACAYIIRRWRERTWGWFTFTEDITGKIIVITGGNSGIGLETARGLCHQGAVVVLACRDQNKAIEAIADIRRGDCKGDVVFLPLDLSCMASIQEFVDRFQCKFKALDVLICNAGVYFPPRAEPVTGYKGLDIHFAVNHLGHFHLTNLLTDIIVKTPRSRIVIVSSELYKSGTLALAELSGDELRDVWCAGASTRSGRNPLYNNSKLANLLHARKLHKNLKDRGVTVCGLSPGFVYTGLFRHSLSTFSWCKKIAFLPIAFLFMRSPKQGAQTSLHCACSPLVTLSTERDGPRYYQNCREMSLTAVAKDDDAAERLWDHSMSLLNDLERH